MRKHAKYMASNKARYIRRSLFDETTFGRAESTRFKMDKVIGGLKEGTRDFFPTPITKRLMAKLFEGSSTPKILCLNEMAETIVRKVPELMPLLDLHDKNNNKESGLMGRDLLSFNLSAK